MNDTHPDVAVRYRDLIMSRTGQERLLMGFSMYDTAKRIVLSAIHNRWAGLTDAETKKEIFLRFYGQEFSEADRKKLLSALCREGSIPPDETI